MSNAQTSHTKLFSRIGLAVSGLVVIAATSLPVASASAQALLVKFDGKDFQLKRNGQGGQNSNNNNDNNGGSRKLQELTVGKGDRDADSAKKRQVPTFQIGKGDRDEDTAQKNNNNLRIRVGKGDRDEDQKIKTKQIVIAKGDRDKADEPAPVKRQIIVEPKVKQKTIVQAEPVVVKKKVVVAAVPEVKKVVIADAEPQVEPEATPEVQPEAPVEEQAVTEAPAETPAAAFKVGQIVTAGDGNSYVIVKVDASGISAMPLTAFTQYQEPAPTYKPVYKKRKAKKRYSSYRNYGYSSNSCQ